MQIKKLKQNMLRSLGNVVISRLINLLLATVKINIRNREVLIELEKDKIPYIAAFWHGKMLIGWNLFKGKNFSALVSQSKDGELLTRLLKKWKYDVVRGSSHKGGKEALSKMIELAKENKSIAVTPDGPTGPINKFKAGAVITARESGIPIVLIGIGISRKKNLRSWDKFEIPKPFSKAEVILSEKIYVDKNFDYDKTNDLILMCEEKLNELNRKAEIVCSN